MYQEIVYCDYEAPQPEDYVLSPTGYLGSRVAVSVVEGQWLGSYATTEEALVALKAEIDASNFWPDIWWVSDHGNCWQIDLEGNEVTA